jgi:hypothetical protein
MKKLKQLLALTLLLATLPAFQVEAETANRDLGKYILAPMPDWYKEGFTRGHLNIPVMLKEGYSRLEAIEIQNQMKDLLDQNPDYLAAEKADLGASLFQNHDAMVLQALQQAIDKVKKDKYFESGFVPKPLKEHEFYAVFDMDETLLVHWYQSGEKGQAYYDVKGLVLDSILRPPLISPDYVSMTPGWEKALLDISKIPGCQGVLVFTAKEDRASHDLIGKLKIGGKPFKSFLKGVFSRNHLVRDNKSVKLSKDLRMIDESLKHVVLIDDNPTRVFPEQQKNLRELPKYNADVYLNSKVTGKDPVARNFFEKLLPTVVRELQDSAKYAQAQKISFGSAFYPYSMEASSERLTLLEQGYTLDQAHTLLRTRPNLFEPVFYVPSGGKLH